MEPSFKIVLEFDHSGDVDRRLTKLYSYLLDGHDNEHENEKDEDHDETISKKSEIE